MNIRRLVRFGAVGVANTAVYFALYLPLRTVTPYLAAHLMATFVAMVFSYFVNCFFTFHVRPRWSTFLLFPLSNLTNIVFTTAGLPVAVHWLGVDQRIAPLPVALLAIPVTYLVASLVMRASRSDAPPAGRTPATAC